MLITGLMMLVMILLPDSTRGTCAKPDPAALRQRKEMTVTGFDAGIYAIRRRPGRRRPFEVRWRAAGRVRSRSFLTRALADIYRAELIRAARTGLEFDPATGEPAAWNQPEPVTVTWYQHAAAYAAARWPELAAHSRSSLADALATITPALTRHGTCRQPDPRVLRAVLYRHAYCPARPAPAGSDAEQILDWIRHASLPVTDLAQPQVLRAALDAITMRLDGSRAAPATITRKHAVLHAAIGYATETGLLDANPLDTITWRVPGHRQRSTLRSWPARNRSTPCSAPSPGCGRT
jgi:hypothetical protein